MEWHNKTEHGRNNPLLFFSYYALFGVPYVADRPPTECDRFRKNRKCTHPFEEGDLWWDRKNCEGYVLINTVNATAHWQDVKINRAWLLKRRKQK